MGTRHLIVVKKDNEIKVAQYGQWDGYPSGQGVSILKFLRNKKRIKKLSDKMKVVRFIDATGKDKKFIDGYNKRCENGDKRTPKEKKWFKTYITRDWEVIFCITLLKVKIKKFYLKIIMSSERKVFFVNMPILLT